MIFPVEIVSLARDGLQPVPLRGNLWCEGGEIKAN
jgi:hypothetical protein